MVRFMSDTPYARLEQEMQHIPGFRPRGSGMIISQFSGCSERQRHPCERIVAGCVPFNTLLGVMAEEVAVSPFVSRVGRLTAGRNPCLFQHGHRERFLAMGEKCSRTMEESATCSAVYLLSADRFLWSRALEKVDREGMHFTEIRIHGVDLDGYVLFHMARDLYQGSRHIRLSELTDPELVSDWAFEKIMTACVIRRYGSSVLREEERSIGENKIGQQR